MGKRIKYAAVAGSIVLTAWMGLTACTKTAPADGATSFGETSEAEAIADKIQITFWHSMGGVNGAVMADLVTQFNQENKMGIVVDAQYQGSYDDAINKLKSAQLGNMGTDLVQIYDIGTRFMVDSGWVIPMQRFIEQEQWDVSQLEPNIAAYYTVEQSLYSMPFNSSCPILYYNKDVFTTAGITEIPDSFEAIEAVGDQLLAQSDVDEVISLSVYGWFFEQLICKQGKAYVDQGNGRQAPAGAIVFDQNGAGIAILEAWKRLADQGYAPNVGRGGDAGLADFSAGKAAMTLGSTASLKQILNDVNGAFEVGTAYFPKVSDTDEGGVSIGGGSLWALDNQNPEREKAVWEFVKFLVSAESQAQWSVQTGYFPVTQKAHEQAVMVENLKQYPQFETAVKQLHDSKPEYAGALLSVFPESRQIVEAAIEEMLHQKKTPQQALEQMAGLLNEVIADYNLVNQVNGEE